MITPQQVIQSADILEAWAEQEGLDSVRMKSSGEESTVLAEISSLMEWVRLFAEIIKQSATEPNPQTPAPSPSRSGPR